MKEDTKHVLSNYQHLMKPHERITTRWLTEEWDGQTAQLPAWLRQRIFTHFPYRLLDEPEKLARFILLRVLSEHRAEVRLSYDSE